jgi:hypothetical protein
MMDILKNRLNIIFNEHIGKYFDLSFNTQVILTSGHIEFLIFPNTPKIIIHEDLCAVFNENELQNAIDITIRYLLKNFGNLKYINDTISIKTEKYCIWHVKCDINVNNIDTNIIFPMDL